MHIAPSLIVIGSPFALTFMFTQLIQALVLGIFLASLSVIAYVPTIYVHCRPTKGSYSSEIVSWCRILHLENVLPSLDSTQSKHSPALLVIIFSLALIVDECSRS